MAPCRGFLEVGGVEAGAQGAFVGDVHDRHHRIAGPEHEVGEGEERVVAAQHDGDAGAQLLQLQVGDRRPRPPPIPSATVSSTSSRPAERSRNRCTTDAAPRSRSIMLITRSVALTMASISSRRKASWFLGLLRRAMVRARPLESARAS